MRNLKLTLSYDGTDFYGWQTQPGFRTVQEILEAAIATLTGERVHANASGRTDTGVHAVGQVVNFYTASSHATDVFVRALNAHLPPDVVVREGSEMAKTISIRDSRRYDARPILAPLLSSESPPAECRSYGPRGPMFER
jgi:tRNA pseudouridine38-40 synthase